MVLDTIQNECLASLVAKIDLQNDSHVQAFLPLSRYSEHSMNLITSILLMEDQHSQKSIEPSGSLLSTLTIVE